MHTIPMSIVVGNFVVTLLTVWTKNKKKNAGKCHIDVKQINQQSLSLTDYDFCRMCFRMPILLSTIVTAQHGAAAQMQILAQSCSFAIVVKYNWLPAANTCPIHTAHTLRAICTNISNNSHSLFSYHIYFQVKWNDSMRKTTTNATTFIEVRKWHVSSATVAAALQCNIKSHR